jgi:hypothetical protein
MSDENIVVTDASGRKLTLKPLDPGDMLDLLEAAGDQSTNAGYVNYAVIVASVVQIDDKPLPRAMKKDRLKANGKLLGNVGLVAVTKELFGDESETPAETAEHPAKN